jgi:hypothetical protein
MKKHSKKNDIAGLLKNKNVLYVVFFLAIANLFSYLMLKQLDAVAFFIIIGFLASYFSKNMIVIMLTSMLSTFLLVQINLLGNVQEGMEDKKEAMEDKEEKKEAMTPEKDEDKPPASSGQPSGSSGQPPAAVVAEGYSKKEREALTATTEGTKKAKQTDSFAQPLNPARYNADDDDDTPRHKPKVDYAGTLESAYDNLDKLLSSDAIKSMTEDTGRLAEKQKQLMSNIEKIQPVMDKAKGILDGFDMTSISKMMTSIGNSTDMFKKREKSVAASAAPVAEDD